MTKQIWRRKTQRAKRTAPEKRRHQLTVMLTLSEMRKLMADVARIGIPRYLLVRWKLTGHPIPRPPIKKRRTASQLGSLRVARSASYRRSTKRSRTAYK